MVAPKLRFDGFDSDWTLDSIGAVISNKSKKYDPEKSEIDFPCIELEHLSQQTGEILGTVSAKDQKSIKNVFDENSVLFGKLRPYLRKFAKPKFQGVCSSEIWVLTSKKMQPNFLFQYVQTDGFSELTQIQAGSKMPRADWGSISNGEILFPIFEEQTKIASFLSAVDEKISQLTQKHQLLSQYKQGMMQKLFSQKIRFKADDGSEYEEWDFIELGEALSYEQPTKYIVSSTEYLDTYPTPVLTAGKSFILGYTNEQTGIFDASNNNVIIFDDFTTAYKFVNFRFKVKSSAMKILKTNLAQNNIYYLYSTFSTLNFPIGDEHKRRWISEYSKQEIPLPCLAEQTKIANFLSAIDQKIEVVAQQIEQAKQWKKGLLQQMFV